TIKQTVTINSDGAVTCVPGDSSGGCNVSAVDSAYGTTASTTKCIWECDSSSRWNGSSCLANSKTFNCTGLPSGMHWISVKLDSSNNIVMSDAGTSLTISQTLNTSTLTYNPSDSDLTAINVNDSSKSPKQLKAQGKLSQSGPTRCYYGCPSGSYYDTGTSTCKTTSCGDGKVQKASGTLTYVSADYSNVSGASEYCDPEKNYANETGRQQLCNAKLNRSGTYYSGVSYPTCSGGCAQGNITATQGTHCQWCGDGTKNGSEKCDGNSTTCYKQDGTYEYDCNQWGNNCSTGKYFDYYNVNCSGSCTWSLGSLYSDNNKFDSGSPSITACSSLGL
ncbi:hypothetical protein J5690_07640, partial [bacterium]|nr:hypothetical protein [bacterium]